MRNLTIVLHDAGGGHRNAAEALKITLEQQYDPWNVSLLNLQELLEPIDVVQKTTGLRLQEGYNLLLKKGWTRLTPQLLVLLRRTIQLHHSRIVRILQHFWSQNPHQSGAFRYSPFQSLPGGEHSQRDAKRSLRHSAHRSGGLFAEF